MPSVHRPLQMIKDEVHSGIRRFLASYVEPAPWIHCWSHYMSICTFTSPGPNTEMQPVRKRHASSLFTTDWSVSQIMSNPFSWEQTPGNLHYEETSSWSPMFSAPFIAPNFASVPFARLNWFRVRCPILQAIAGIFNCKPQRVGRSAMDSQIFRVIDLLRLRCHHCISLQYLIAALLTYGSYSPEAKFWLLPTSHVPQQPQHFVLTLTLSPFLSLLAGSLCTAQINFVGFYHLLFGPKSLLFFPWISAISKPCSHMAAANVSSSTPSANAKQHMHSELPP
jgi:hypothetical protein